MKKMMRNVFNKINLLKKLSSVKGRLFLYFGILFCVSFIAIVAYGYYSIRLYNQQFLYRTQTAMDLYSAELTRQLEDLVDFNQETYSDDGDFHVLAAETLSSPQKVVAQHNLRRVLRNRAPAYGAVYIFSEDGSQNFYSYGSGMQEYDRIQLNREIIRQVKATLLDGSTPLMEWQTLVVEDTAVLFNAYRLHDLYVCSLLDLEAFFSSLTESDEGLVCAVYSNSQILTNQATVEQASLTLEDLQAPQSSFWAVLTSGHLVQSVYLPDYGVGISGIQTLDMLLSYIGFSVLLLLIVLAAIFILYFVIYALIKRMLIYPLDQISNASHQLTRSMPKGLPVEEEDMLEELDVIRVALEHLVFQKVDLENKSLAEEREKEHAMLQYYQLQTRSHFFLNCLKSLYSMLEVGDQDRMKVMILAFSNHLRYIFRDNLALVPLQSELDEVADYYSIIQMDRRRPLLLTQDVAPGLGRCQVPPLVIQTFLENSYRHFTLSNRPLHFSIQIDKMELEEKPYLRIRLSDNGGGYDDEALEKLNSQESGGFEQYHVGIQNLKRRMALIYHGDYQIAFFNSTVSGGACSLICLPLQTEPNQTERGIS